MAVTHCCPRSVSLWMAVGKGSRRGLRNHSEQLGSLILATGLELQPSHAGSKAKDTRSPVPRAPPPVLPGPARRRGQALGTQVW